MKRADLLKYEYESVMLNYKGDIGPQSRTGVVYAVTMKVVIFWPFEQETEITIPFKDISSIEKLKGNIKE